MLSAHHAAKQQGWTFLPGPCAQDSQGAPTAGVAVLSRWPVEKKALPSQIDPELQCHSGRWQVLQMHRPARRPFVLVNLYLHASDRSSACRLGHLLFELTAQMGEDCLFIGDWNNVPDEEPALSPLRGGRLHLADEIAGPLQLQAPTRTGGRHIDYALHSMLLVPSDRGQVPGVADHDLVFYSFPLLAEEASFRIQPARALLATEPVSNELWGRNFDLQHFHTLLEQSQIEEAWIFLSNAAEICLQAKPGRKRSSVPAPSQVPRAPVKPDTLQTTLERRLRRTYRRVLELQKPSWPWRLLNKVREELRRFARIFPELTEFDVLSPRLPDILLQCIQRESDASSERRLARWHTDMNENEQALIRWVKGADKLIAPSGLDSVPVHPQLKAEHFGREWQAIWCPHSNVEPERVLPFLSWIRADEFFCPEPVFTDTSFVRLTKQASGKAAGPDGWKADQWLLLPEGFYSAFSALWRRILDIGILPSQWAQVRCVLIPKDVGFRPISIACLAWRLGISCILHQLPPWIDQWAPPELVGGLKARSSTIVHDDLHEALQESTLFGAKIDVAKCFDHVNIEQAFIVWEKFGAPAKVVNILKCFYRMQVKSFEWQGFCSRERIRCTRGILQGCPRSCALLAGLMTVWCRYVQQQSPSVQLSVYIDDRTLWCKERQPLQLALDASQSVDQVLGLRLNCSKCELFYKCRNAQLQAFQSWNVACNRKWKMATHFKLLGVHYFSTKARRRPIEPAVVAKVQARLRRLRMATHRRWSKRRLVRSLVLSLFSHTGAWTTIPKKLLQKWRYAVETTMLGYPQSGRSRYLMWACFLTPELDPEFALDSRVVFHELWRLRREAAACQSVTDISRLQFTEVEPCERSSRLLEVLQKWGWERLSKSRFRTPSGVLDLLSHGETRVTAAMKAAWKRQLWLSEPRAAEVADLNVEPVIAVHVACMKQGQKQDPLSFSIACAAGPASRKLAKRFDLNHVSCVCGADWPSCRHVTWHCPDTNLPEHTSAPANGVEERLLVRSIAPPPQPPDLLPGDARPPVEICSAFISQMALFDGMILVATDGSCKTRHSQKRAAWGIATESQVFAFPMKGCDQNIFAAETWAVFQALHAAHLTGVRVRILCDSQAVVFAAARVRRGGSLPRWASGMWRAIALLSPESVVSWVPAHGRSKDWTPPDGHSPAVWRTYNDRIDAAVQAVAQPCADSLSAWARRVDDAMAWSGFALARQKQALLDLRRHVESSALS